jgi:uncharacterized protein YjiS (DUF1127 family)
MSDPTRIYLQPECCADPDTGRMWASQPDHECEHGVAWTEYVLAEEILRAVKWCEDPTWRKTRATARALDRLRAELLRALGRTP